MEKKIFISYSDGDRERMRQLQGVIKKSKHLIPIIIADRRESTTPLTDKVIAGIAESDYVVPIMTVASIGSQWVNQEIGYAVASGKEIIPIVEQRIMSQLKGFIHKNIDLPYNFTRRKDAYSKICAVLVRDLLIINNAYPKAILLGKLFGGIWKSEFTSRHITGWESPIEIRDGNKYFVDGNHIFIIDKLKVNMVKKTMSFVKIGIANDKRELKNDLKILKLGEAYEGTEQDKTDGLPIKIKYSRIT